jgi:hypothetical protein
MPPQFQPCTNLEFCEGLKHKTKQTNDYQRLRPGFGLGLGFLGGLATGIFIGSWS